MNMVAEFREAVQNCNLQDMGSHGYPFTWSNKRYGPQFIEERLDRIFCSKHWGIQLHASVATNLANWTSDHSPIIFEFHERSQRSRVASKSFPRDHYEDMWSSYDGCKKIVKEAWDQFGSRDWESPVQQFQRVAKALLTHLKTWSKTEFKGRQTQHDQLLQRL